MTSERGIKPLTVDSVDHFPVDPLVRALTRTKVDADIAEYLKLLDGGAAEAAVHQFLATHFYFFNGLIRLFDVSPLYSKVKLGSQYEVDFAFFDLTSFGPEWNLIEIEAPSRQMFTKAGNPTAALTHAIQQVRDWHAWVHENLDYARKLMPKIEYPMGYVFIGRRVHLTSAAKEKLRRFAYENRNFLHIHTLDWFAGWAHSVKDLLRTVRPDTGLCTCTRSLTLSWPMDTLPRRSRRCAIFPTGDSVTNTTAISC